MPNRVRQRQTGHYQHHSHQDGKSHAKDYEIVSPECGELRILRYNSGRHDSTSMIFSRQITAVEAEVKYKFWLRGGSVRHTRCPGYALGLGYQGVTLEFCVNACCADSKCLSFNYNIRSECYLKSKVCSPEEKKAADIGNMYDRLVGPEFPVPHTPVKFAVSWSRPWISGLRMYGPGYFLTLPDSCSPCTCTDIYAPHTWRVLGSG
ncbi:hypothetical protein Bbelb_055490 [Branchiostoma belcheri]|nr:hypothetical protein Bbelb_055490 [Branchiostoma belcheri]